MLTANRLMVMLVEICRTCFSPCCFIQGKHHGQTNGHRERFVKRWPLAGQGAHRAVSVSTRPVTLTRPPKYLCECVTLLQYMHVCHRQCVLSVCECISSLCTAFVCAYVCVCCGWFLNP